MTDLAAKQQALCRRFGTECVPPAPGTKLGVAMVVGSGLLPLHGLRHPAKGDTCGWYLWAGEAMSDASDFFEPLHVDHLTERCPSVLPYLGLGPGWRFLIANGHEDVWYDASLLDV